MTAAHPVTGQTPAFDRDVVVVGSGFGGSVAALRLAEKRYDVLVLEAGRRFADADLPTTSWRLSKYLWVPRLRWFGVQRIHWLNDVLILAGAGVGGGSLVYANVLYVPPAQFFTDPQWGGITDWAAELAPYYRAGRADARRGRQNPCEGPVEELMRETAESWAWAHLPQDPGRGVLRTRRRRRARHHGGRPVLRRRRAGAHRLHAVRQLHGRLPGRREEHARQELPGARRAAGVHIEPLRTVRRSSARPRRLVEVDEVATDGSLGGMDPRTASPRGQVVFAAGTWGTQRSCTA